MLEFSRRNDPWPFTSTKPQPALSPYGGIAPAAVTSLLCGTALSSRSTTLRDDLGVPGRFDWRLKFRAPVRAADTLRARATVKDKRLGSTWSRRSHALQRDPESRSEVVCTVEVIVLLATRAEGAGSRLMNHVIARHVRDVAIATAEVI